MEIREIHGLPRRTSSKKCFPINQAISTLDGILPSPTELIPPKKGSDVYYEGEYIDEKLKSNKPEKNIKSDGGGDQVKTENVKSPVSNLSYYKISPTSNTNLGNNKGIKANHSSQQRLINENNIRNLNASRQSSRGIVKSIASNEPSQVSLQKMENESNVQTVKVYNQNQNIEKLNENGKLHGTKSTSSYLPTGVNAFASNESNRQKLIAASRRQSNVSVRSATSSVRSAAESVKSAAVSVKSAEGSVKSAKKSAAGSKAGSQIKLLTSQQEEARIKSQISLEAKNAAKSEPSGKDFRLKKHPEETYPQVQIPPHKYYDPKRYFCNNGLQDVKEADIPTEFLAPSYAVMQKPEPLKMSELNGKSIKNGLEKETPEVFDESILALDGPQVPFVPHRKKGVYGNSGREEFIPDPSIRKCNGLQDNRRECYEYKPFRYSTLEEREKKYLEEEGLTGGPAFTPYKKKKPIVSQMKDDYTEPRTKLSAKKRLSDISRNMFCTSW